jgi:hypothetical protein
MVARVENIWLTHSLHVSFTWTTNSAYRDVFVAPTPGASLFYSLTCEPPLRFNPWTELLIA